MFDVLLLCEMASFIVCFFQIIFFINKYLGNKGEWELLFIAFAEFVSSFIHVFYSHSEDKKSFYLIINDNKVNWVRYVLWLVTLPLILKHLYSLIDLTIDYNERKNNDNNYIKSFALLQLMIWFGIYSTFFTPLSIEYWFFCIISWVFYIILYYTLYILYDKSYNNLISKNEKKTANNLKQIFYLYFLSWLFFPLLFMLGPESFGVIDMELSNALHAVGDLVAKNYFGLLAWKFHWKDMDYSHTTFGDAEAGIINSEIMNENKPINSDEIIYTNVKTVFTAFEELYKVFFLNSIQDIYSMDIEISKLVFILNNDKDVEKHIDLLKLRFTTDLKIYVIDDTKKSTVNSLSSKYIITNSKKILRYNKNVLNPKVRNNLLTVKNTLETLIKHQEQYMKLEESSDEEDDDDYSVSELVVLNEDSIFPGISTRQNTPSLTPRKLQEKIQSERTLVSKQASKKDLLSRDRQQATKQASKQASKSFYDQPNIKQMEIELDTLLNYPQKK